MIGHVGRAATASQLFLSVEWSVDLSSFQSMEREREVASGGEIVIGMSLGGTFDGREVVQGGNNNPLQIGTHKFD